jgi:MFS family permease
MLAAIAGALVSVPLIYALVLLTGVAGALESPAQSALLASIVPRQALTRAFTVNSASRSITSVSGPALGGILIATSGIGATYVAHLVLAALATLTLLPLRAGRGSTAGRLDAAAIREGIGFVRCQPVLLGSMTLDMFAVLFGGARALLPIYAVDILRADAVGYGLLSASIEIGTLLMALVLLVAPTAWQSGGALLGAVAAFGVATIAFGVSRWLPLSIAAYALVGMADQVSMVLRHNITQLNTPDALRGRVTGVSSVFISASNELGALESGLVAAATSPMFAVVSGGLACLVVVGLVAWWVPSLRRYQIGRPF